MKTMSRLAILAIVALSLLPGCTRQVVYRYDRVDTQAMRVLPNGKVKPIPPGQLKKRHRHRDATVVVERTVVERDR